MLERLALPEVEQAGLDVVLVTEVRHRDLIRQVSPQDRRLVLRRELAALFASVLSIHGSSVLQSMER